MHTLGIRSEFILWNFISIVIGEFCAAVQAKFNNKLNPNRLHLLTSVW